MDVNTEKDTMKKMVRRFRDEWDRDYGLQHNGHLTDYIGSKLFDLGYRLDPYPNGKSKSELIAHIEALEAEQDAARVLLHEACTTVLSDNLNSKIGRFLAETSTVKL